MLHAVQSTNADLFFSVSYIFLAILLLLFVEKLGYFETADFQNVENSK